MIKKFILVFSALAASVSLMGCNGIEEVANLNELQDNQVLLKYMYTDINGSYLIDESATEGENIVYVDPITFKPFEGVSEGTAFIGTFDEWELTELIKSGL